MATKRKTTQVKTTVKRRVVRKDPIVSSEETSTPTLATTTKNNRRFILNTLLVILIGAALFLIVKRYRGLLIAGTVNKSPITRMELNQALTKRYGRAVLDEIINERLLLQQAAENKITVDKAEIESEIKKLEDSLGGRQNLENAMVQYNINQEDLEKQVKLRLLQQKLTDKLITTEVTDQEAKEYYEANKSLFEGKSLEEVQDQIVTDLKDQKRQEKFSEWFQELKTKAQVVYYLDN